MDVKTLSGHIGLEIDEYLEMLDLFLESGGNDLVVLETAVTAGNATAAHGASHSLKGSAGSLGLEAIQRLAEDIDSTVRRGVLEGVAERTAQLRRAYEILAAEVSRLRRAP
jgi:HPt (histidine-containing phosphotransfer) domain-containing protein